MRLAPQGLTRPRCKMRLSKRIWPFGKTFSRLPSKKHLSTPVLCLSLCRFRVFPACIWKLHSSNRKWWPTARSLLFFYSVWWFPLNCRRVTAFLFSALLKSICTFLLIWAIRTGSKFNRHGNMLIKPTIKITRVISWLEIVHFVIEKHNLWTSWTLNWW